MSNLVNVSGRLADRVVVVTGGSGGIGHAFMERARREGAKVCNWDFKQVPSDDPENAFFQCDVTSEASVERATSETLEKFGRIDALVNCAGIVGAVAPTEDYTLADWQKVFSVNVVGTFLTCRAVIPIMKAAQYGRIVNLASVAGKEGNPNQSAYSASKAAVISLTKSVGKELASTEVRVNCVAPAIIDTPLLRDMGPEQKQLVLDKIPIGRVGDPKELAAMLLWLASEECSYSTGAVFDLSGGRATY